MVVTIDKCRACGEIIYFIRTQSGKFIPINTNPVRFYRSPLIKGKERFVLQTGEVVAGTYCAPDHPSAEVGYISHFATCPKADSFRKKEQGNKPEQMSFEETEGAE